MTVLTDPIQLDTPSRSPVKPTAPVDLPLELGPKPSPAERWFEVSSPNGYFRTVVGTIEYVDGEADTYMVRERTGGLVRVPVRDINASTPTWRRGDEAPQIPTYMLSADRGSGSY